MAKPSFRGERDAAAIQRMRSVLSVAMEVSRPWTIAMIVAAVLSAAHVNVTADGDVSGDARLTTLTAVFVALIWLPSLLRVVGLAGGAIKTPAGEASTTGLLDVLKSLDPDTKRERLPQVIATLTSPEVIVDPDYRPAIRTIRRDLELQLAEATPRRGGIRETLDAYAQEYEQLRREVAPGRERTLQMTTVTAEARAAARTAPLTTADLRNMMSGGRDGERVIALALAQDQADSRLFDVVLDAIVHSRSAFEQYQALGTAFEMAESLDGAQKRELAAGLRSALANETYGIRDDSSRGLLVDAIFSTVGER
jgi:hypothetical protein